MKKAQLMAGMALSIVLAGSLMPTAWSKDVATMNRSDRSQPTALSPDCELASNPNIRFFKAPNCTPDEKTSPSTRDSFCDTDSNIESFISRSVFCHSSFHTKEMRQEDITKGMRDDLIYPKANQNIHLN